MSDQISVFATNELTRANPGRRYAVCLSHAPISRTLRRADKRGSTPEDAPPIFQRIGLQPAVIIELVSNFGELFLNVAGESYEIARSRSRRRGSRFRVRSQVQAAFASSK
ncbi:hypothetical protein [Aureliella helgolandensis]|nr:hypothetical protein [Aureliella helgolandensis]